MTFKDEQQLVDWVASCHYDPLKFVVGAYPWGKSGTACGEFDGPDTWQEDLLYELGEALRQRNFNGKDPVDPIRITRASGHGIGKGVASAFITDFIMSTRPHCQGTVTANSYPQLETKTWAAIRRWTRDCITGHWFKLTSDRMFKIGEEGSWFTAALSCAEENSQSFAGQHSASATSFYIFDEASTIKDKIFEVADGGMTDGEPIMIIFGNPTQRIGKFFRINFGDEIHRWNHKAIDSRTCRHTNKVEIGRWAEDWGSDSDRFRVQVMGLPPNASDIQFISSAAVGAAKLRAPVVMRNDPVIGGLDVSRGGKDPCVIRFRRGRDGRSIPPIILPGESVRDSTVLETKVVDLLKNGVPVRSEASAIQRFNPEFEGTQQGRIHLDMLFVDGTGVGGPVCDHLKALGYRDRVIEVQFGAKAPNTSGQESCANMRSWMWSKMRDWLNVGSVDSDPDLEMELTAPLYHYRPSDSHLVLEDKDTIRKRIGRSTDHGDALCLTFARPVAPKDNKSANQMSSATDDAEDWEVYSNKGRVWG